LKSVDLFKAPYQDCLKQLLKVLPKTIPSEPACSPGHFIAHLGDPNQKGLLPLEERLSQIIPGQNPYITGTPLPGNSPVFFGREQILHEILSALRKPGKPSCISLLGERRIGKSSLLNQICQALKTKKNLITVYGNAQNQSQCTPEEFFRSIHQSVCVALSVNPKPDANTFELFRDFIREQARNFRFVLVMDEFEDMAANKNFGDTFFTNLRHLGERHEYAFGFLLASRRPLHEICHQNDIASSSFWNIFGISHILGLLWEHEAEALIREPMKRSLNGNLKNTDAILFMTGFHPALIQMVMDKYHTAFSGKYRPDREQIIHGLRPYFQDLWKRRTKEERELLIRLAAEESVESDAVLHDLKFRGLVCNGKLFSPVFADFVREMKRHDL
jgi:serine/threonine-protein kinase